MIKQFHVEALGYEPRRMKPVHFANGFFRCVLGQYGSHLLLNRMAVIEGSGSVSTDEMLTDASDTLDYPIDASLGRTKLSELRIHLNSAAVNDDAVYAVTSKTRFCDYTLSSGRMVTNFARTDGAAGEFITAVFRQTEEGKAILDYARELVGRPETPLERFLNPLLDAKDDLIEAPTDEYQPPGGRVLKSIAKLMRSETRAIALLVKNLDSTASHYRQMRYLVIGLLAWLLAYLHRLSFDAGALGSENPVLLMDFSAGRSRRMRMQSRLSFAQNREIFSLLYARRFDKGELKIEAESTAAFTKLRETEFRILEEHYNDLAVKSGIAQPRSVHVARKHYELQPDTTRVLISSVVPNGDVVPVEELARKLRDVWGVCLGACDDDASFLLQHGHHNLGDDEDLKLSREGFISFLKTLNLASEPSDGLVLCANQSESLL